MSNGDYSLPVILFAFSKEEFVIGTVFMTAHILAHIALGLSIVSSIGEHPLLPSTLSSILTLSVLLGFLARSGRRGASQRLYSSEPDRNSSTIVSAKPVTQR